MRCESFNLLSKYTFACRLFAYMCLYSISLFLVLKKNYSFSSKLFKKLFIYNFIFYLKFRKKKLIKFKKMTHEMQSSSRFARAVRTVFHWQLFSRVSKIENENESLKQANFLKTQEVSLLNDLTSCSRIYGHFWYSIG